MSLESNVATILRESPVGRINFTVGTVYIDKLHMESVAKAWSDCDDLRAAIRAHPAYSDAA